MPPIVCICPFLPVEPPVYKESVTETIEWSTLTIFINPLTTDGSRKSGHLGQECVQILTRIRHTCCVLLHSRRTKKNYNSCKLI